jgi:predicted nucleic acid-binding protein
LAVLDTNILVDLMRKRPGAGTRRVVELVRTLLDAGEILVTTRFNAAELYVGAELSSDPVEEAARIDAALGVFQVLEFDDAAARAYARIDASLSRAGRPVGDMDALIASIALSHVQPLVTRNPRHFTDIPGLVVYPA